MYCKCCESARKIAERRPGSARYKNEGIRRKIYERHALNRKNRKRPDLFCKALCEEKFRQIEGNGRKLSHIELSNCVVS